MDGRLWVNTGNLLPVRDVWCSHPRRPSGLLQLNANSRSWHVAKQLTFGFPPVEDVRHDQQTFPDQPFFNQALVASSIGQELRSPTMPERIYQRGKRGRLLPPARIVEVIA